MSPDSFGVLQTDPEVLGVSHKICKTMYTLKKKRKRKNLSEIEGHYCQG